MRLSNVQTALEQVGHPNVFWYLAYVSCAVFVIAAIIGTFAALSGNVDGSEKTLGWVVVAGLAGAILWYIFSKYAHPPMFQ